MEREVVPVLLVPQTHEHAWWEKPSSTFSSPERDIKKTSEDAKYMWASVYNRMQRPAMCNGVRRETDLTSLRNTTTEIRNGYLLLMVKLKRNYNGFYLL